jgi:protein SCO1
MTRRGVLIALVAAALGGEARAQYGLAPWGDGGAGPLPDVAIQEKLGAQVPLGLTFNDEHNRPVTLGDCVAGKPTILVMAYYRCPQLCTQVLNSLVEALRALPAGSYDVGKQFNVITVSFDPKEKPPLAAVKKQSYLEEYGREGAEAGWHFLTGDKESIDALAQAVGFTYEYDAKKKLYNHASGIMVLSPSGVVTRYFFGLDYPPQTLRLTLVDASDNKVGAPADKALMLLCFMYDPAQGKYTPSVLKLLRLAAAVTVVLIGGVFFALWRKSRYKPPPAPAAEPEPAATE